METISGFPLTGGFRRHLSQEAPGAVRPENRASPCTLAIGVTAPHGSGAWFDVKPGSGCSEVQVVDRVLAGLGDDGAFRDGAEFDRRKAVWPTEGVQRQPQRVGPVEVRVQGLHRRDLELHAIALGRGRKELDCDELQRSLAR